MPLLAAAPTLSPDLLARLYQQYLAGGRLVATDSRTLPAGALFFALNGARRGAEFAPGALAAGAGHAVVDDPGLAATDSKRYTFAPDPLAALQALAHYHRRQFKGPVIALTGSNGKTTTKELLAGVLSRRFRTLATGGNFNNHIGVPLTLLRLEVGRDEIAVVEMGANHPREIAGLAALAEPTHGLITNIGKAHLEGFGGTQEHVARAKGELFEYLEATGGTAFVNLADGRLAPWAARLPGAIGYPAPARLLGADPFVRLALDEAGGAFTTQISGAYNFENLAAAAVVGRFFGVEAADIRAALAGYAPTNNRSQLAFQLATGNHLTLDAYNANPSSVAAAVRHFATLPGVGEDGKSLPKLLILGDMLELGGESGSEHRDLGALLQELGFEEVLLVGPEMAAAAVACPAARHFATKADAAAWLAAHPPRGRRILLKGSRGIGLETLVERL